MKKLWQLVKSWFKSEKVVAPESKVQQVHQKLPYHYQIALDQLGIKEVSGKRHNPLIVDMFRLVTGKAYSDETAWCAAFVGSCLHKAGIVGTGKLNARSFLSIGTPVPVSKVKVGDIAIFWRGSRTSWKGHVGFYAGETAGFIKVLGGNQNNSVSIANYPKHRLIGYMRV